jgi:hypothetical protein
MRIRTDGEPGTVECVALDARNYRDHIRGQADALSYEEFTIHDVFGQQQDTIASIIKWEA